MKTLLKYYTPLYADATPISKKQATAHIVDASCSNEMLFISYELALYLPPGIHAERFDAVLIEFDEHARSWFNGISLHIIADCHY